MRAEDASGPASDASLRVDLAALLRTPGNRSDHVIAWRPEGLASSAAAVVAVDGTITLEGIGEKLSASGPLDVAWTGDCRRCLEPAGDTLRLDLREFYEKVPEEGETYQLPTDETLDLEPMLREQALLSLPVAPLCRDDCAGPAPDRFPASVEVDEPAPAEDDAPQGDPRWAALDGLTFDE